jgi:CHASE2 domain-containing sensor protein
MVRRQVAASLKKIQPNAERAIVPFGKRLLSAAPVILTFTILSLMMEHWGWLSGFETTALDTFFRLKEPLTAEHIVVVGITEEDYKVLFEETSPLSGRKLREVMDAITLGRPSVVGVDIDTSSLKEFGGFQVPDSWPVTVWGRDAKQVGVRDVEEKEFGEIVKDIINPFAKQEDVFVPGGVLAGDGAGVRSGLAILPQDSDGRVRRYSRSFKVAGGDSKAMDSFPWAVVKAYHDVRRDGAAEPGKDFMINFSVERAAFKPIDISTLLSLAHEPGYQEAGPLKGKVVLLGGFYRAGRDEHLTPTGTETGVQIMGQIIESELSGAIPAPSKLLIGIIEAVVAVFLLLLTHIFRLETKLRLSLMIIPLLALLSSYVVFSSFALWSYFIPVLLALLIQQLHDRLMGYRKALVDRATMHAEDLSDEVRNRFLNRAEEKAEEKKDAAENPENIDNDASRGETQETPSPDRQQKGNAAHRKSKRRRQNRN